VELGAAAKEASTTLLPTLGQTSQPPLHDLNAPRGDHCKRCAASYFSEKACGSRQAIRIALGTSRSVLSGASRLRVLLVINANPAVAKLFCLVGIERLGGSAHGSISLFARRGLGVRRWNAGMNINHNGRILTTVQSLKMDGVRHASLLGPHRLK